MSAKTTLLLATLAAGCVDRAWVGDATPLPQQDAAVALAWASYGAPGEPPPVLWRTDRECGGESLAAGEERPIGWHDGDACVQGQSFDDHVEVAADPVPLHRTNLAHELCHSAQLALTGDPDHDHKGPCFNGPAVYPGSMITTYGGLTDAANWALAAAGM
jgi:hypothetical protein